jgi:hypothetical protein
VDTGQGRQNSGGREGVRRVKAIQQLRFGFHGAGFGSSIAQSIATRGRYNDGDDHQVTVMPTPIRKNASTPLKSKDLYVFSGITVGLLSASKYADITESCQIKPLCHRFSRPVIKQSISLHSQTELHLT